MTHCLNAVIDIKFEKNEPLLTIRRPQTSHAKISAVEVAGGV